MATNDFLLFSTDPSANVATQASYIANADRPLGNQTGIADALLGNKAWRQSSIISSMIGQLIVDYTGQNAVDDGTIATLEANMLKLIRGVGSTYLADSGVANVITVTMGGVSSYANIVGVPIRINIANTNTGPATININGLGAISILSSQGVNLAARQLLSSISYTFIYDGSHFILQGSASPGNFAGAISLSGNQTLNNSQAGFFIYDGTVGARASWTLPNASAMFNGAVLSIATSNANGLILSTQGGNAIRVGGLSGGVLVGAILLQVGDTLTLVCDTSGSYIVQGGIAQNQFSGQFAVAKNVNGYQKFPSGLLLQWGLQSPSNVTFTFPIAFPSAGLALFAANQDSQGTLVDNAFGYFISNSQGFVATKASNVANTITAYACYWAAIGY